MFSLERISVADGRFLELEDQWRSQAAAHNDGEEPEDYYPTMMVHARRIAEESPQDPRYGIYALVNRSDQGECSYEGLIHINHKLPRTSVATTRMVWNILAPKYDYDDPELVATVMASYVVGGIKLCRSDMRSSALQMYLHNGTDRRYTVGAVSLLRELNSELRVSVRGMWLHIDNVQAAIQSGTTL